MTDNEFVLCLLCEDFQAAIDDLNDHKELQEECNAFIRMFGYDKKKPISMILTGFYMGFRKGMELDAKITAYKDQNDENN